MTFLKKITRKTLTVFMALLLMLAIAANFQSCAPEEDKVELGYVLWDCANASTHVMAALIEDELGKEVNLTSVDAGPMWMGLARGDFDAMVTAWLPGTHDAYYEQTRGDVVNLGANLDGARIGWVVPAYVPVSSIDELHDYADEFNAEITGIDPGAGLMAASERAIDTYDLDYNLLSGSDAAMTAALERAINRDEWIIVTGWTPHWKFAAYDLKYLEDPKMVFGDDEHIATVVHPDLAANHPDVYRLLDNFYWTPEDIGTVMGYIEDGMEPFAAARKWIADNRDLVNTWLP